MPGFDNIDNPIETFVTNELKKYSDEDMIWIYDEAIKLHIRPEDSYTGRRRAKRKCVNNQSQMNFNEIEEFKDINEIRIRIKRELEKINELDLLKNFFQKIKTSNNFLKNKNDFLFLRENERLCHFAINFIENTKLGNNRRLNFHYFENPYIYLVYHFTFNQDSRDNNDLHRIKSINIEKISKNYHNNSNNFKDKEFVEWTYAYVNNKDNDFHRIRYKPALSSEFCSIVVSFLDYLLHFNTDKHYSLTNQLYKAWSQKKFRAADKIKKPYHLPLTKKAKTELKQLSKFNDKTESEVLEELIHQMYLQQLYDENKKYIY